MSFLFACAGGNNASLSSSLSSEPIQPNYAIPLDEAIASLGNANDARFDPSAITADPTSPLKGKTLYWLGSSVTYGSASSGYSMADYLAAKTGARCVKDAVSGTTLFDDGLTQNTGKKSYVRRLKESTAFQKDDWVDAFICQISTNDCTNDRLTKRGALTDDTVFDAEAFDTATTLGAMEFIVSYVSDTWDCPVYFYSGAKFVDGNDKTKRQNANPLGSEYEKLVNQSIALAKKWNKNRRYQVGVIDLYHDEVFNAAASDAYYAWATQDPIHPKKAGYLQWWEPYFEAFLSKELKLAKTPSRFGISQVL